VPERRAAGGRRPEFRGGRGGLSGPGPAGVLATSDEEVVDAFARRREFQVSVPRQIGYTVTLPAAPA
jgi:hypothetical protein